MVRALSFSKSYDSKNACSDITLKAQRGKATVLLGPNGAGKSTLLKAFAAQHYASSGKILAERDDGAVFDAAESPRQVKAMTAFVSEVPALYDDWTVWEFLCMAAELRNASLEGAQSAALLCGLDSVLSKKISSLSHGFKQRVNFAQALVCDPQIVILDEPATGLDPLQIREMRDLVKRLKNGRAVILSTHIIQEAEALSDTIAIVSQGRVAACGTVKELLQKSGQKTLEDAYLFYAGGEGGSKEGGKAINRASAPTDSGASNDSGASSNFGASSDSGAANDSSAAALRGAAGFGGLVKKELRAFAINPFYWIFGIAFSVFCAAAYFFGTRFFVQGLGSSSLAPFFLLAPYVSSALLPAFCMNIKSRAFDQSLPFGEGQKAAARLVSALIVFALYLAPTLLVPLCVSLFGTVFASAVFVSYLALLFFAAAALSLCVFLSTLVQSRAAYFALAVLLLSAASSVHNVLNYVQLPDFLCAAIRSISFAWRFDSASKGVLDTRDFLFFALFAAAFLFLTVFCEESRKGKKYFSKKRALKTWTVILIFVFLFLDSGRLYKRVDFTPQKIYSPSQRTLSLLDGAQEKVRVTYFRSPELLRLYPQVRDVGDFLRSISLSSKNFWYSEMDANRPAAQKILSALSIPPFQIQTQKNSSLEFSDAYSAIVIDYMDKSLFVPAAFSTLSLEYDLNLRLDYLLSQKSRSVYVLCGNGMSLKKDYKAALDWLGAEGFETIALSPSDLAAASSDSGASSDSDSSASGNPSDTDNSARGDSKIPLDPKIPLALFGSASLDSQAALAIENFLNAGGPLFAALSPYSVNVDGDWSAKKNKRDFMLPILERRGISFLDSLAADLSCVRANFHSAQKDGERSQNKSVNYPLWISLLPQKEAPFGLTAFWASPLSLDPSKAEPLLYSSPASWRFLPNKKDPALLFDTNPFTVPKSAISDPLVQKEPSVLAARTKDKKILLASGDLFVNDLLLSLSGGETGDFRNLNYLSASLLLLTGEEDMAALKNKGGADFSLWKPSGPEEWNDAASLSILANFVFAPLLALLFCAIFFFRRKAFLRSKE